MQKRLRFYDQEYWPQVCIALSQISFGVAWASLFLPLDVYKVFVISLNMVISAVLISLGWFLRRKR